MNIKSTNKDFRNSLSLINFVRTVNLFTELTKNSFSAVGVAELFGRTRKDGSKEVLLNERFESSNFIEQLKYNKNNIVKDFYNFCTNGKIEDNLQEIENNELVKKHNIGIDREFNGVKLKEKINANLYELFTDFLNENPENRNNVAELKTAIDIIAKEIEMYHIPKPLVKMAKLTDALFRDTGHVERYKIIENNLNESVQKKILNLLDAHNEHFPESEDVMSKRVFSGLLKMAIESENIYGAEARVTWEFYMKSFTQNSNARRI